MKNPVEKEVELFEKPNKTLLKELERQWAQNQAIEAGEGLITQAAELMILNFILKVQARLVAVDAGYKLECVAVEMQGCGWI